MARTKSQFRKGRAPNGKVGAPIRRDIDSLIQGISQQPPHLRTSGQGARQVNGWSSPVEGLTKRNAVRLQAKILDQPVSDFYLELMDISDSEQYTTLIRPADENGGDDVETLVEIRRGAGVPTIDAHGQGLSVVDGTLRCTTASYLHNAPGSYYKDYVLISNGSLALLLNRNTVTAYNTSTVAPVQQGEGLIFVRAVAYNVTYTVSLDDVEVATFSTPSADADQNEISTSTVASSLATTINDVAGYSATVEQYVVHVKKDDGADFKLSVDDSRSAALANGFTDTVQTLANLPVIAPDNYIVEVESDPSTTIDNRWLRFNTFKDDDDFGEGAWQETVRPGIPFQLDSNTMPMVIYRAAEDVFFIGPADGASRSIEVDGTTHEFTFPSWGDRSAGDERTTPDPEFLGSPIRDHVIFRSRYVVCASETVQFSETDDIFNFFSDTSLAVQATDPFGLRGTSERSSALQWMIPVEDSILAFSSTTQFQIRAADADVLTPLSGSIFRLSNLEMNSNVRPKLAGSQVLFATDQFGFTHFREFNFYNQRQTKLGLNLGSSLDVTNFVPKYIKGLITHWDVGEALECAVSISPTNPKELYVYKYLWATTDNGSQKLQRSWSKWELNQDVRWVRFRDNALWMLVTDETGTYFCVQLNDETEIDSEAQIHLDRLVQRPTSFGPTSVTATYDADTDLTTFTLPYSPAVKTEAVVRFINGRYQGLKLGETDSNVLVCTEKGDWTSDAVAFGEPYQFLYEFNRAFIPDASSDGQRIVGQLAGRTQVLRWRVNHVDTGLYNVRVSLLHRQPDTVHTFRARSLNYFNNRLDETDDPLDSGYFEVPVCSRNDQCSVTVESDSWLPLTITSASWKGVYSDREKAV